MSSSLLFLSITFVVIPKLATSYTKTCGWYGCDETTINCPSNEDCHIKCSGSNSCASSTINCPSNYQCTIDCSNTAACYDVTVYAQHSSKLEFTDCKSGAFDYTCSDMTVYCPPNINGNKKCIIPGDNAMGGKHEPYMQFYAINGWNDIDFSGYTGSSNRRGTMHCTNDYSQSCSIDSNSVTPYWTCTDENNICMHPPTPQPTTMPTITPTNSPTNVPTKMPTKSPTEMPTKTPTEMPSIFPTITPTRPPIAINSKDTKLVISDDLNSDSLEVKDVVTTEINAEQIDEAINVTTKHNTDMLYTYILWIGLGLAFAILICIVCIYCMKSKAKPKIYHIDHYGDKQNIEMEPPKDGNKTIIPPKNGKLKYSPFGAVDDNIINIQSEIVIPRVKIPTSTLCVHSMSKVSMDITPYSASSMKYLDSFVLDAKNDDEVLGNDMGVTPQFDDAVITPHVHDTPQSHDNKNDFDIVIHEDINDIVDQDMIIHVNNDMIIDGNGIIETKGNEINNIECDD